MQPVFRGASVAYFATPATESESTCEKKTLSKHYHSLTSVRTVCPDRAELAGKFADACLTHGVQYGIIISIVGAGQKIYRRTTLRFLVHTELLSLLYRRPLPKDTQNTLYQQQFSDVEAQVLARAGKRVDMGPGDTGTTKFKPIILRAAPFYQVRQGQKKKKNMPCPVFHLLSLLFSTFLAENPQNFYGSLNALRTGVLYYPLGGEKMGHVDLNDVAEVGIVIMLRKS